MRNSNPIKSPGNGVQRAIDQAQKIVDGIIVEKIQVDVSDPEGPFHGEAYLMLYGLDT